jgi:hypothetical protein
VGDALSIEVRQAHRLLFYCLTASFVSSYSNDRLGALAKFPGPNGRRAPFLSRNTNPDPDPAVPENLRAAP